MDANRITARFWLGAGITGPDEMAQLAAAGVTAVISAAWQLDDTELCVPRSMKFFHVPWADDGQVKPVGEFFDALNFLLNADCSGNKTDKLPTYYVHCVAGVNRGPLLCTFLLAALSGMDGDATFALIKAQRPQINSFNVPAYRQSCLDALHAVWNGPIPAST